MIQRLIEVEEVAHLKTQVQAPCLTNIAALLNNASNIHSIYTWSTVYHC